MSKISQQGFASFLTILLFLLLIGAAIGGWWYFQSQPIKQDLPRQLQLPTPLASATPNLNSTYINKEQGFTFNYPPDWQIKESSTSGKEVLHQILIINPQGYIGTQPTLRLLSLDNSSKLTLKDLDQRLITKKGQSIVYSVNDVYVLTGSGLGVNFRDQGDCDNKKCQIYTFEHEEKVYQLESFLEVNALNQKEVFDSIINSFRFADFTKNTLGASASAVTKIIRP